MAPRAMKGETEDRVKALLTEGLSNKEIADRVHLSLRAVKGYTGNLLRERGLYGPGDSRRLIVLLVREMFALTDGAAPPTLPASSGAPSIRREELGAGEEKKHHADDAAQL